tara:strand:+ start:1075 stop:1746 length:672 start_codon:yes stop_codon:yes gene_type:complete
MYAIVKDGSITATGTIKQLFPNTSFAGGTANEDFKTAEGVMDVVEGERKDEKYYFVTQGNIELVDGEIWDKDFDNGEGKDKGKMVAAKIPTQKYTNTAKRLVDEDAKDADGNQLYVQVYDPDYDNGEGNEKGKMVDTSEKLINKGLKTVMTTQVKDAANKLLAQTDWTVIRKAERDVAIPSATATHRAAVITECTRLETEIANAANVDALATVMAGQNWPTEG